MYCAPDLNRISAFTVKRRLKPIVTLQALNLNFAFKTAVFILLVLAGSAAQAQYNTMRMNFDGNSSQSGFGLTGGVNIDVPMHNLKEIYKASPSGEVGLQYYYNNWVFGLHGSYRVLQPKQSTFYEADQYGTVYSATSFGSYVSYGFYLSAMYQFPINPKVRLVAGINSGNYFSSYKFISLDAVSGATFSGSASEPQGYIAPKLGLSFRLTEDVSLGVHTQYNVFGNYSYSYNSREGASESGTIYTSWASGVSLSYRFP
ncbi:hypothetical protein GCM10027037_28100 [Mucilaginibacter koreensis]